MEQTFLSISKRKKAQRLLNKEFSFFILFVFFCIAIFVIVVLKSDIKVNAQEKNDDIPSFTQFTQFVPNKAAFPYSPKIITLKTRASENKYLTYGSTVEEILSSLGLTNLSNYRVIAQRQIYTNEITHITLIKVYQKEVVEINEIPFSEVSVANDNMEVETTNVIQEGIAGSITIRKMLYYEDNIVVKEEELSREVTLQPQNKIIEYGTKPKQIWIDGDLVTYCKTMYVRATAYDRNCEGCSGITSLGYPLKKGIIAVDPKVIPYYTTMYVPGYGYGTALDTGGGVRGNSIDLGFEDFAFYPNAWTTRSLTIYIMCN